jgi:hypothetical protein
LPRGPSLKRTPESSPLPLKIYKHFRCDSHRSIIKKKSHRSKTSEPVSWRGSILQPNHRSDRAACSTGRHSETERSRARPADHGDSSRAYTWSPPPWASPRTRKPPQGTRAAKRQEPNPPKTEFRMKSRARWSIRLPHHFLVIHPIPTPELYLNAPSSCPPFSPAPLCAPTDLTSSCSSRVQRQPTPQLAPTPSRHLLPPALLPLSPAMAASSPFDCVLLGELQRRIQERRSRRMPCLRSPPIRPHTPDAPATDEA